MMSFSSVTVLALYVSCCDLARSHRFAGYVMLVVTITDAGDTPVEMYWSGIPESIDTRALTASKSACVHSSTDPAVTTATETTGSRSTSSGDGGNGGGDGGLVGGGGKSSRGGGFGGRGGGFGRISARNSCLIGASS